MNGKKKKNKKLDLDLGKVSHYLRRKLGTYNLHFLERN